jgi:branched-chain amino acid transport system substrate-binding protein
MKMSSFRVAALVLAMWGASAVSAQILIGQSADLSGPVAASVKETILGSQLLIDQVKSR